MHCQNILVYGNITINMIIFRPRPISITSKLSRFRECYSCDGCAPSHPIPYQMMLVIQLSKLSTNSHDSSVVYLVFPTDIIAIIIAIYWR